MKTIADNRCNETLWTRKTCFNLKSFSGQKKFLTKSEMTIYTDGSKTENGVGADIVIYYKSNRIYKESFKLPDSSTVFQAEILAIQKGAEYVVSIINENKVNYIKLLTDSQAAILALNKTSIKNKSVWNTIEALETLAYNVKKLTVSWVKAHVNATGNEQADQAAKDGAPTHG